MIHVIGIPFCGKNQNLEPAQNQEACGSLAYAFFLKSNRDHPAKGLFVLGMQYQVSYSTNRKQQGNDSESPLP